MVREVEVLGQPVEMRVHSPSEVMFDGTVKVNGVMVEFRSYWKQEDEPVGWFCQHTSATRPDVHWSKSDNVSWNARGKLRAEFLRLLAELGDDVPVLAEAEAEAANGRYEMKASEVRQLRAKLAEAERELAERVVERDRAAATAAFWDAQAALRGDGVVA